MCMQCYIHCVRLAELQKLAESRKWRKIRVTWAQGHSRSSNLAPIERAYDLLLVTNSNLAVSLTLSELRRRKGRNSKIALRSLIWRHRYGLRMANMSIVYVISHEARVNGIDFCCRLYIPNSALCLACWAAKVSRSVVKNSVTDALRDFGVIQGHRIWQQSHEHITRLPTLALSCTLSELEQR